MRVTSDPTLCGVGVSAGENVSVAAAATVCPLQLAGAAAAPKFAKNKFAKKYEFLFLGLCV